MQVRFASDYVSNRLYDRLSDFRNTLLYDFIRVATQSPSKCSSLSGGLFEIYCHRILRTGGTFPVRSLESDETDELVVPALEQRLWGKNSLKGSFCFRLSFFIPL